jgi:hypothetical protein
MLPTNEVIEVNEMVFDLSQPPMCLNKKYKYLHFMIKTYLYKLEIINIVKYRTQTLYYDGESIRHNYYIKLTDISFPEYLNVKELNKMTKNKNYIKTFERKCKLKKIKK